MQAAVDAVPVRPAGTWGQGVFTFVTSEITKVQHKSHLKTDSFLADITSLCQISVKFQKLTLSCHLNWVRQDQLSPGAGGDLDLGSCVLLCRRTQSEQPRGRPAGSTVAGRGAVSVPSHLTWTGQGMAGPTQLQHCPGGETVVCGGPSEWTLLLLFKGGQMSSVPATVSSQRWRLLGPLHSSPGWGRAAHGAPTWC